MKKVSAILLIALFLFNLFGYRIWLSYEQLQSDIKLEASLDKQQYNDADLISISVPLSLPYVGNQQNFERIDGEITVNGRILKYVKRKISEGKLVLLCLPDNDKMRIESAKDDFFKYANDLVQNGHSKKPVNSKTGVFKNQFSDYYLNTLHSTVTSYSIKKTYNKNKPLNFLPSSHIKLPEQPPEVI